MLSFSCLEDKSGCIIFEFSEGMPNEWQEDL